MELHGTARLSVKGHELLVDRRDRSQQSRRDQRRPHLTQIARLANEGLSNAEIGTRLSPPARLRSASTSGSRHAEFEAATVVQSTG
jgi:hypothetical protein